MIKILGALLGCVCVFFLTIFSLKIYDNFAVKKAESVPKIIFSEKNIDQENSGKIMMTADEFEQKDIEYDIYRSNFHYEKLSEEEQLLYRCLEFALENGYPNIYIDNALISDNGSFSKALRFLALDSPLLEHNLEYSHGTFTDVYEVGVGGWAVVEGLSLKIGNINDKVWESKLDAIENARKIVEKMPKNLGEAEKAKYLHSYTVENVDYFDYGDKDKNITYLYDGIVGGKTNCDGSTNMYALLLNIAGVDCYEKWHKGEGETSGHTWNMVEIDGVWYNVDATSPLNKENFDIEVFQKRYFAFEDRMQKYAPAYGEIYPEVKANLEGGIYTHINKIDTKSVADTAKKALSESEDKYVLFLVDEYSEDASLAVAQRLANSLYKTVYSLKYEVMGGKHLLAFYL